MYSDADLEAAVTAGVLTAPTAAAFRAFVARQQEAPGADEEHFRLLTGFNDVFVAIAGTLCLVALAWMGSRLHFGVGGALVAAASWGMAEYFTRRRRMALPSILLLLSFVGGVYGGLLGLLTALPRHGAMAESQWALLASVCAVGAALAAYAHWRRFMVPITVAAGAAAAAGAVWLLFLGFLPDFVGLRLGVLFLGGVGMFALAMWWDMSDRARITRRADIAFWLHLAAAPLIVHPMFGQLGLLGGGTPGIGAAVVAVLLYLVLAVVALVVDRRALLVSALAYVLYAITVLLRGSGSVGVALAPAALVIGCGLLLLSALWHRARRRVVLALPPAVQARVPPV